MPRISRGNLKSTFLHIMVQGLNKEFIFNDKQELKKYFSIIVENEEKADLTIVAYCLMNNHAHLLIKTESVKEVSNFMKKVNTKYAIYYNKKKNRCGYVFRDRYKVEQIMTSSHLICCINYIHNNPVKAGMCKNRCDYQYSSYNDYVEKKNFVNERLINECLIENGFSLEDVFRDRNNGARFIEHIEADDEEKLIKDIIDDYMRENKVSLDEVKKNKEFLKNLIIRLYIETNIKQIEIAHMLGITPVKVNRIINKK